VTPTISRSRMLAGSAAVFAWPRAAGAQQLQRLRLIGVQTDDMTPVYYALSKGMYQKAGLEIELVPASSGTAATAAVVSGTYQLGKGSVIASLLAHIRNLPLVFIANGVVWDVKAPVTLAVVTVDSPIKTARDLAGKTASAAALNDIVTLSLNAWTDKNGGDSSAIKWVEIPNSAETEALLAHRVDICSLNEPQLTAALQSGKVRVFAPCMDAIGYHPGDHFIVTAYFARADWAAQNPQACRNFERVTYEAARYTNAHHAETAQMVADITKIPVETIRKINRPPGATSSDPALLQPVIDAAAKYKNIPRTFPAKEMYFGA
jgi:NitT/TauT family transport system substrate-binding protein